MGPKSVIGSKSGETRNLGIEAYLSVLKYDQKMKFWFCDVEQVILCRVSTVHITRSCRVFLCKRIFQKFNQVGTIDLAEIFECLIKLF